MKNIRIERIADMVKEGMVVADIGTDHALLPILLVKNGKSKKVYACDIAEGPLSIAKENIQKYDMQDNIQTILSNGFEYVPMDTQVVVIAGMGYITASMILNQAIDRLPSFKQIITEINRNPEDMRQWISDHHYTIDDEAFVHERNHDYAIISFTTNYHESYTKEEIELGPILMHQKDEEYLSFCKTNYNKISTILEKSNGKAPQNEFLQQRVEIYRKYLNR